jgi:hypothetical protein
VCDLSTFLPAPGEGYSQTLFSDMSQFVRSSGTPTVAKSSESEPPKDGSPVCMCSRETFGCSTHPTGKAEWIASMRASLASLTPLRESARERMTSEISGLKSSESLGKFGPGGSFWKTCRDLFLTGSSELSSVTWPSSGMMLDGRCWELTRPAPRTEGSGGGLWPTPNTQDAKGAGSLKSRMEGRQMMLHQAVKMWPTPTRMDYRSQHKNGSKAFNRRMEESRGVNLVEELQRRGVIGQLNPTWVEWLMAWPLGWTVSNLWETGKSRFKRPLLG